MAVLEVLYRLKQREFAERLREMSDPHVIYVTDLVSCSHKRVMRRSYPLLSFRFEPSLVIGDLVHYGLEKLLQDAGGGGGVWEAERPVEKRFNIDGVEYVLKGRVDLLYVVDGAPRVVVEVKTGRDLPGNEPLEHHKLQVQVYMEMLGVGEGYLLYITPERVVEHPVERANLDLEAMVRDVVYNRVRPRYQWECRYCPYRRLCPYALSVSRERQQ